MTIIVGIACLAIGAVVGFLYRKSVSEKKISSAEEESLRIVNEAIRTAESKKKEALLEAKEEILKSRSATAGKPFAAEGRKPGPQVGDH